MLLFLFAAMVVTCGAISIAIEMKWPTKREIPAWA